MAEPHIPSEMLEGPIQLSIGLWLRELLEAKGTKAAWEKLDVRLHTLSHFVRVCNATHTNIALGNFRFLIRGVLGDDKLRERVNASVGKDKCYPLDIRDFG